MAGIIAAVAWAVVALALVIFFVLLTFQLTRLLEEVRLLVDGIRKETVPLLGEVRVTVTSVNKELDRVDGVMESAGHIVKSAERLTTVVERAVSSPLIKLAAVGAGASRAVRRLKKGK